jgi:mono/diheme cytochrome c family protein
MRKGTQLTILFLLCGWMSTVRGTEWVFGSVWDGVYDGGQAARGEAAYRQDCAGCHGMQLEGQGRIPGLAGSDFASDWEQTNVGDLFEKIQYSMPGDRPGELSPSRDADIVAYILKVNRFPAGPTNLPSDADALRIVRIETARFPQ